MDVGAAHRADSVVLLLVWVHAYLSLFPSPTLLDSAYKICGAPPFLVWDVCVRAGLCGVCMCDLCFVCSPLLGKL